MRIRELDGLRGIAVLTVIYSHYMGYSEQFGGLQGTGAKNGWLGVDLFFVLSGFLITSILIKLRGQERYFVPFYQRRSLRIFPPYFLALAIYFVASILGSKMPSPGFWAEYVFYLTSLRVGFPPEIYNGVLVPVQLGLGVLWSLSVEEVYYTVWAPVVRYTSRRGFTAVLIAMIVAAPLLRWWLHTPGYPELYNFSCRMDALADGSVLALLIGLRDGNLVRWKRWDRLFNWLAVGMSLATLVLWTRLHGDRSYVLLTTVALTMADLSFALIAFAILRYSGSMAWPMRALRVKWLRSVGMISYSLYLFHYPIWFFVRRWVLTWGISYRAAFFVQAGVALVVSLAVAYGLWYGMESRILNWKDRKIPSTAHPG